MHNKQFTGIKRGVEEALRAVGNNSGSQVNNLRVTRSVSMRSNRQLAVTAASDASSASSISGRWLYLFY